MIAIEPDMFDTSSKLKVKPFCKPDVHLKKSRQRVFSENSIELIYSFGYQSYDHNLCMLRENIFIIVTGNHLNFLNINTLAEDFLPSINGASFTCVASCTDEGLQLQANSGHTTIIPDLADLRNKPYTVSFTMVHPTTIFFAAAEKGEKFCINVFSYPALEVCKTLKEDSAIMPTRMMKFHPQGDLLIALSCYPENKIYIWHWELESVLYISSDLPLFIHSMSFSSHKKDVFVTSGEKHVMFWEILTKRYDRNIKVLQQEEKPDESPKYDVTCTVSISNTYLSATGEGYLLLWHPEILKFDSVIKISLQDKPCHDGCIWHIIIYKNYFVTLGSDGYMKFWDYDEIVQALMNVEDMEKSEEAERKSTAVIEIDKKTGANIIAAIQTSPEKEFLVSNSSDLVCGIITKVKFDNISFVIQDRNGILFQVVVTTDLSNMSIRKLLSGLGCNIAGLSSCPLYPFISVASSLGNVAVYSCVDQTVSKFGTFSSSVTCMIWPSAKLDLFTTNFLIGFNDGTIKWVSFSEDIDNFILKFVIKPHTGSVEFMKMNESCTVLISQGSDSKLFFYSVESFSLTPLGYYINHHEVIDFVFLKYFSSSSSSSCEKFSETLLILCKHSYIIESAIPDLSMFKDFMELRKTYFIECEDYQVYKINGLRQYHELGDRIYDSDCEEIPDLTEAGKAGLCKLKYDEKREKRESRRLELGFSGPVTPPEILSYLPSATSNHIWLSLGKEDFGYIFEFQFEGKFSREPLELVPIRALEILTAEVISVLSMQYSPCGNFIFMGLEDGSLNLCCLDEAFMPSSAFDFAKFQLHDPENGAIVHVKVSPEGSFIITAGCDGNILLFKFSMFEYQEIEDYGEKPILSDVAEAEDIPAEMLSLEEDIKHKMNEKYCAMKESRISALEKLKDEYSTSKNVEYSEYLNLCKSSLKALKDIPEELKMNPEELSSSQLAVEIFSKSTNKLQKGIDALYQKDLIKLTLRCEKYFKFFEERIEQEVMTVKNDKENIFLSNFRSCVLPSALQVVELGSYPCLIKPKEKDSMHEKRRSRKVWSERIKLENQLAATRKAIIEYPSDTPISEIISRYNKRKEEQIKRLQEHIAEYEILESTVIDDKKYNEILQEIKDSQFKFKGNADHSSFEYWCAFSEKKAGTALYFRKIHKFWNNFTSLFLTALKCKTQDSEIIVNGLDVQDNTIKESSQIINSHIYYKKEKNFEVFKDAFKILWGESVHINNMPFGENIKEDDILELKKGKMEFQENIHHFFMSILMTAKPKVDCEKKFFDTRFILKCIELNSFKLDLMKEKKCLRAISELGNLLHEENLKLSALEERMLVLRNKRQAEKNEWMTLYNKFRKAIGLQNKHKGYLKKVFKKKIRSEDQKDSYKRHPSSESSESEQDIMSEDDSYDINPSDIDKDLLREVMHFRLKRHEVEKNMKEYKRDLISHNTKLLALQKRFQKTKDALEEAWRALSTIPANRKIEIENMIWPVVLYPENVHKDFFGKRISITQEEKALIHEKMSQINETVLKELKPIDKLIRLTLIKLIDKVVKAELMDLIDIACAFFPLLDNVAKDVDEYFFRIGCPDSSETLKKVVDSEKKPVNIIEEILSAAASTKESQLKKDSEMKMKSEKVSSSVVDDIAFEEDISKETISSETVKVDYLNYSGLEVYRSKISIKSDSDISLDKKKHILKSWRDVCNINEDASSSKIDIKDIDINSFILDAVPILDSSLFVEDKCLSEKDYYMLPLSFEKTEEFEKKLAGQTNLAYADFEKMLFELDVSDVLQDVVRRVVEEEEFTKTENLLSYSSFPTYPGGGLFLTKSVLIEMEKEDPDKFPYTNFYQEIADVEEKFELPEQVHVVPHYKEIVLKYELSSVLIDDFILLSINDILEELKAYNKIKISTSECEEQLGLLEKKLSKAKRKSVNVEQELVAISREKTEEMNKKFSRIMDLHLLQDIIENPHLRIRKYESERKLDSLKKDLRKLKASEINALKSLDTFEYEDTIICQELSQLRQEFQLLNKKYSSNLKNFPHKER